MSPADIRGYVMKRASICGRGTIEKMTTSLRAFLRYLAVQGHCRAGLDYAVPAYAHWQLAEMPRYLSGEQLSRLIAACDGDASARRRDRAIVLLLARLGLRAGDVAQLRLIDIEWQAGSLRVTGKSRHEVRLPLPDRELAYLDIPLVPQASQRRMAPLPPLGMDEATEDAEALGLGTQLVESTEATDGPALPSVVLRAEFAGRSHSWKGTIVRTEGEIDAQSRMVHIVAQVSDPYGVGVQGADATPLAVGMFVEAEIFGRKIDVAYVLPRSALRGNSRVYVVDADNKLHFRDVEVLRMERERVVIGEGLSPGDRVCISALSAAVEGMSVRERGESAEVAEVTP